MDNDELERLMREELGDGRNCADSVGSWIVLFSVVVLVVLALVVGVSSVFAAELEPQAKLLMDTLQAVQR